LGKEAVTYRFTQDEKRALDHRLCLQRAGHQDQRERDHQDRLNYLVEEYRRNGANSILARVLALLNQ
jgi:hypothetical protein